MLPQPAVMITAPIAAGQAQALATVLDRTNAAPGFADPNNALAVSYTHLTLPTN